MENNSLQNFTDILDSYLPVIKRFKNLPGVQNGYDVAWKPNGKEPSFENTPKGLGDGLGTTGFCVSASEALLNYEIFQIVLQSRNAKAKLISIDIKEQYYGYCYNGSQNKWHTAILLFDGGLHYVIDITCRQFGNNFIEKDIWDFQTWQDTLRSPICTHVIIDFESNQKTTLPVCEGVELSYYGKKFNKAEIVHKLHNINNLSLNDRHLISNFFVDDLHRINHSLSSFVITAPDTEKLNNFIDLLDKMPTAKLETGYSILKFKKKLDLQNWIEFMAKNNFTTNRFLQIADSIENYCKFSGLDFLDLHKDDALADCFFIILKFNGILATDISFVDNINLMLPPMFNLNTSVSHENIYNMGLKMNRVPAKKSNTVIIEIDSM